MDDPSSPHPRRHHPHHHARRQSFQQNNNNSLPVGTDNNNSVSHNNQYHVSTDLVRLSASSAAVIWKYKSEVVDQFTLARTTYKKSLWFSLIVGLGALQVGYHLGYSSPTESQLESAASISGSQADLIVSILNIGAMAGCFLAAPLSDKLGRVWALALAGIPVCAGSVLMFALDTPTFVSLFFGRVAIGIGIGIFTVVVPIYIVEIAPTEIRGLLGCVNELMIYLGIFVVTLIGIGCGYNDDWWRVMLYFAVFTTLLMTVFMFCLPETPRWLFSNGQLDAAERNMGRLRNSAVVGVDDYANIIATARANVEQQPAHEAPGVLRIVAATAVQHPNQQTSSWNALMIGCAVQIIKQFSGVYAVQFYAVSIFETSTSSFVVAISACAALYLVVVAMLFLALMRIESYNRRSVVLTSLAGITFFCLLIAIFGDMIDQIDYGIFWKTALFVGYLGCFALGIGPVSWIFCSEVFPSHVRSTYNSIATAVHWFCAFIVTATFSELIQIFGHNQVFYLYGGCCVLGMAFLYFLMPETKGRSLEQIEVEMQDNANEAA